jgi:hypothetical protein
MVVRRLFALLLAGWTAALPLHIPVIVCFCSHGPSKPHKHRHSRPRAEGAISEATPSLESCRCVALESSQDLVRARAFGDPGAGEAVVAPQVALAEAAIQARRVPPAVPRALGPPIFLRLLALLV